MDAVLQRHQLTEIAQPQADEVIELAEALARFPSEAAASLFTSAVERLTPGDASSRTLWRASELIALVAKKDADGRTALEVVVTKWLSFGYPWALEVPPEALARLRRRHAEARSGVWAALTLIASVVSGGWYLLLLAVALSSRFDWWVFSLGAASVGCFAWLFEMVRTMATAKLDDRELIERCATRLGRLGLIVWAAPLSVVLLAPLSLFVSLGVGLLLAPLSLSGAAALVAARRLERD